MRLHLDSLLKLVESGEWQYDADYMIILIKEAKLSRRVISRISRYDPKLACALSEYDDYVR